jgi:hypothetical protein
MDAIDIINPSWKAHFIDLSLLFQSEHRHNGGADLSPDAQSL